MCVRVVIYYSGHILLQMSNVTGKHFVAALVLILFFFCIGHTTRPFICLLSLYPSWLFGPYSMPLEIHISNSLINVWPFDPFETDSGFMCMSWITPFTYMIGCVIQRVNSQHQMVRWNVGSFVCLCAWVGNFFFRVRIELEECNYDIVKSPR